MEAIGKRDELISRMLSLPQGDQVYTLQIKEWKKKRSLNANAYCWLLVGKLADVLRASKEEIYLKMLENYGQSTMVAVSDKVDVTPFFKYFKEVSNSNGYINYQVYKGSSEYDTKEMAVFIDGIIYECESVGIETITPKELAILKGEKYEINND